MYEVQHGNSFLVREPQIPLKKINERDEDGGNGPKKAARSAGTHGLPVFISTAHGVIG